MTKRDYTLIANTLADEIDTATAQYEYVGAAALRTFARTLADRLAGENVRFNRDVFLRTAHANDLTD